MTIAACSSSSDSTPNSSDSTDAGASDAAMSFFVTSAGPGDGANLGGLAGADVHCSNLAEAAGTADGEWRAYLSTTGADGVNAIDRIGSGPWINANGVTVATSTENLLSDDNNLNLDTALTETGNPVSGINDPLPLRHDILTGTSNRHHLQQLDK